MRMLDSVLHKICSLSYTYQVRHGWGVSCVRNRREARALYEFCLRWFLEGTAELNPQKSQVLSNTMALYYGEQVQERYEWVVCECGECRKNYYNFYDYVNDHCGWYWY